nr:hypothetical protein RTCK_01734 [Rhizobium sp. TCK]
MRFLLTSALILASAQALASSITPLSGHGERGSVITKSCTGCPPPASKEEQSRYRVPVLETGPQKIEIVEIDGEKKIVRTDAWLGGSPVVHVSKMQDWMIERGGTAVAGAAGQDGIDHTATVGAVEAGMTASAAAIDLDAFTLRLSAR